MDNPIISIEPEDQTQEELEAWLKRDSQWGCFAFKVTTKDGKSWIAHMTADSYELAMLKKKLIEQGADESDLEDFGQRMYEEGSLAESQNCEEF